MTTCHDIEMNECETFESVDWCLDISYVCIYIPMSIEPTDHDISLPVRLINIVCLHFLSRINIPDMETS